MQKFPLNTLTVAVIAAPISACGGGGGSSVGSAGAGPAIPPSGGGDSVASSSGTIDGSGSIFVNGVRWKCRQR